MHQQPHSVSRPLDQSEWFFWMTDHVGCVNFAIFAELTGHLTKTELRQALDDIQYAHPLLRVKVTLTDHQLYFVPAADRPLPLLMTPVARDQWPAHIAAQLDRRFADDDYPLVRCLFLNEPGTPNSLLALVFHHSLADGRSGANLLCELLARLAQPSHPRQAQPAQPPLYAAMPEPYQGKAIFEAAAKLREIRKEEALAVGRPAALPALRKENPERQAAYLPLCLDETAAARLRAACSANRATINGALCAAQLLAIHAAFEDAQERALALTCAADMRPYLEQQIAVETPGMYASLITTHFRLTADSDFWELARSVSAQLKTRLQRGDGHVFYAFFPPARHLPPTQEGIAAFGQAMLNTPQVSLITNLGEVPAVATAPRLNVHSLAFIICPTPHQLLYSSASTYAGRLFINVNFDAAKLDAGIAQVVADRMRTLLTKAATGG